MAISQQFIISLNQLNQKLGETARLNTNVAESQKRVTSAFESGGKALRDAQKFWDDIGKAQARYNTEEAKQKTHQFYDWILGETKRTSTQLESLRQTFGVGGLDVAAAGPAKIHSMTAAMSQTGQASRAMIAGMSQVQSATERATGATQAHTQAQNVAIAGANRSRMAVFQLAAGVQDAAGAFQQMGFTTQGWNMAMRGASNNLGALALGMGSVGAIGGTLALAVLPPLIDYMMKLDNVAERTRENMGKLFDEMERMKKQSESMRGAAEDIARGEERIREKLKPKEQRQEERKKQIMGEAIREQIAGMTPEQRYEVFEKREQAEIDATTGKEVEAGKRGLDKILQHREEKARAYIEEVKRRRIYGGGGLLGAPGEKGEEERKRYIESQRGLAEREFYETQEGKAYAELKGRYEVEKRQATKRAQERIDRALGGDLSAIPEEGKGIVSKAMPKAIEALGKEREKVVREQEHDATEKRLRDRQNEIQKEQDRNRQARSDIERRLDPRQTGTLPRGMFPEIPVAEGKLGTGTQKRLRQAIEGIEAPLDRESFQLKEAIEALNKTLADTKEKDKTTEQLQTLKNMEQLLRDMANPENKPAPLMRPPGAQRPAGQAPQF